MVSLKVWNTHKMLCDSTDFVCEPWLSLRCECEEMNDSINLFNKYHSDNWQTRILISMVHIWLKQLSPCVGSATRGGQIQPLGSSSFCSKRTKCKYRIHTHTENVYSRKTHCTLCCVYYFRVVASPLGRVSLWRQMTDDKLRMYM